MRESATINHYSTFRMSLLVTNPPFHRLTFSSESSQSLLTSAAAQSMPVLLLLNKFLLKARLLRRVQDEHLHADVRRDFF